MAAVTGGGLPAQLWRGFMADALAGRPARPLPSLSVPVVRASPAPTPAVSRNDDAGDSEQPEQAKPAFWDRLLRVFGG